MISVPFRIGSNVYIQRQRYVVGVQTNSRLKKHYQLEIVSEKNNCIHACVSRRFTVRSDVHNLYRYRELPNNNKENIKQIRK